VLTNLIETGDSLSPKVFRMPCDVLRPHGRILSITFCKHPDARMRPVVFRSRAARAWRYPRLKCVRPPEGDSFHETNALRLADCDPAVEWYIEQNCEIVYLDDAGEKCLHYPDLLLFQNKRYVFWEEKPRKFALQHDVPSRTELLQHELPALNFDYEMKYAEDLLLEPRLTIATQLVRFGRRPLALIDRWQLQQEINRDSTLTWGRACTGGLGPFGREMLCRAVLEGILSIDLGAPITRETCFFPGTLEVWK
jgi:hypothetical protein